jgi:hypothetical protein
MSQSHTHAPGEVHNHSHGPPEPQQQQVTLQTPDPALQAIIEADFRPVDLIVGAPNDSFAYCPHSSEKCSECGLDFINLNRLSKLLTANPMLKCPPPPNVISQKLSTVINTTKEEGNVRVFVCSHLRQQESNRFSRHFLKWANTAKLSVVTQWLPALLSNAQPGNQTRSCAKNYPPSSQTAPPPSLREATTLARWLMPNLSSR